MGWNQGDGAGEAGGEGCRGVRTSGLDLYVWVNISPPAVGLQKRARSTRKQTGLGQAARDLLLKS